jgi:membrane dipeptidase
MPTPGPGPGLVVDTHAHVPGFVPRLPWAIYRFVNRRTMPPALSLDVLPGAGVDVVVAAAVGDPLVTRWWRKAPLEAVDAQLDVIETEATRCGARIVTDADGARDAHGAGRTAVVLALEGGDPLAADPARLDHLVDRGLRLLGLVHFADNGLGTICMPWQDLVMRGPWRRRRRRGLTEIGAAVVDRCAERGVIVDLAHADDATIFDVCDHTRRPVVVTHTGARALQDFARFVSDDIVRAVAATGGFVGLWPFRFRHKGIADLAEWTAHAEHLVDLVGPQHLALGTDTNGVPGTTAGYDDVRDLAALVNAFADAGLEGDDLANVLGGNALRVLEVVATAPGNDP